MTSLFIILLSCLGYFTPSSDLNDLEKSTKTATSEVVEADPVGI